jgi:hypothetical protein
VETLAQPQSADMLSEALSLQQSFASGAATGVQQLELPVGSPTAFLMSWTSRD